MNSNISHIINKLNAKHSKYIRHFNDFQVIRLFTKHKYSNVFVAIDSKTQTPVFMKELIPSKINERIILMFYREIHSFAITNCEFINKLVGYTINQRFSIILEYHDNDTFSHFLKKYRNKISPTHLSKMILAISAAMVHLHMKNIVHRDLKPSQIIIDKNKMPKLNDLWNSRLFARNKPLTRMIGTLNVMAPELMIDHVYTKSVDVYSYGTLLYYVCEGKLPFSNKSTEQIVVAVSVDHKEFPFNQTPVNLQELIRKCTNPDSSQRPTFINICNFIANGVYSFPNSNKQELRQAGISMVDQQRKNDRSPNIIVPDDLNESSSESKILFTQLDQDFNTDLLSLAMEQVTPENFDVYFNICSKHMTKENFTIVPKVIHSLTTLVETNHHFLESISYSGFFECPILRDPKYIESVFHLVKLLILYRPNFICSYMKPLFKILIELKSSDMILLFSFLAKKYEKLKKPEPLFDIILSSSKVYINKEYGVNFIRLLYFMIENIPKFKESRLPEIRLTLTMFLSSDKEKTIIEVYSLICQLYDKDFLIPYDAIYKHIQNESLKNVVISLLLRINTYPIQRKLGILLVNAAKTNSRAAFVLLKYSEQQYETAIFLATKYTAWMKTGLGNSLDTYRLIFILLRNSAVRSVIGISPDFINLLQNIANQKNEFAFSSITIILKAVLSPQNHSPIPNYINSVFESIDNSNFFQNYFTFALHSESKRILQSSIILLDFIGKIAFSNSYLLFFPKLINLISEQNDLSYASVQVFVILSQYKECHSEMEKLDIINYFKSMLNFPDYKDIAQKFLKNINSG